MLAAATGGVKEVDIGSLQIQELEGYWEARLAYIELEIKAVFHRCPETRSRDAEQVGGSTSHADKPEPAIPCTIPCRKWDGTIKWLKEPGTGTVIVCLSSGHLSTSVTWGLY